MKSPFHLKKNKLKRQAFQPPEGKQVISVIRQRMGDNFCKDMGVALVSDDTNSSYKGLAVSEVGPLRKVVRAVVDFPEDFVGHAHVEHPQPFVKDPEDPMLVRERDLYYDKVKALFVFHLDPSPDTSGWTGPALGAPAPEPEPEPEKAPHGESTGRPQLQPGSEL